MVSTNSQAVSTLILNDIELEFGPEVPKFLRSINAPFSITTIAGPYRSGKSTLSNIILDQPNVFKVGDSTVGCTRGLWICKEPLKA